MGVNDAWAFLDSIGIRGHEVDPKRLQGPVQVDTLSLVRQYIITTEHNIVQEQARTAAKGRANTPTEPQMEEKKMSRLARAVNNKLAQNFKQSDSILHFDGSYTKQKEHSHLKRMDRQQEALQNALAAIARTQQVAHSSVNNQSEPSVSTSTAETIKRSEQRRVIRASNKARSLCKTARTLSANTKTELMARLEGFGWHVCGCHGEADVCISNLPGPILVATSDSDFLFQPVQSILRQDPFQKSRYREYRVEEVLETLKMSRNAWAVVGTVTSNDYGHGIPGYTIKKNVEVVQSMIQGPAMEDMPQDSASEGMLENSAPENMHLNLAPEDMLLDYCERLTLALVPEEAFLPSQFSQSKSIFLDHHEDLVETIPSSNSAIDVGSKSMARDVRRFLKQYANARRRKGSGVSSTVASSSSLMTPDRSSASGTTAASRPVEPSDAPNTNSTPEIPIVLDSTSTTAATAPGSTEPSATQLRQGIEYNHVTSKTQQNDFRKELLTIIREMVRVGTELERSAEQAIALYTAKVFNAFPEPSDPTQIAARRERLKHIAFHNGDGFFGNLFQDFYSWHDPKIKTRGRPRNETPANACVKEIIADYREFLQTSNADVPRLKETIQSGLSPFMDMASQRFRDTLQVHYTRNISELAQRVKEHNQEWSAGTEGRCVLDDIGADGKDAAPYLSAKKDFQEFLKECLCKPEERKADIRESTDWKRHVLTGTITTNGHELKVLATSLTKAAPPPSLKKRPNTTRSKLKDVRELLRMTTKWPPFLRTRSPMLS
ncbi:MAG: hypothetical protein J3Q66DRAFT_383120 [Benniella sp.]|nr:MAG: hypothetical protein J3Q66DRAFT_383120 [Benniella sp.]